MEIEEVYMDFWYYALRGMGSQYHAISVKIQNELNTQMTKITVGCVE